MDVAIIGASGYAGGELIRFVDAHPALRPVHLGANTHAGEPLAAVHPHLGGGHRILGSIAAEAVPDVDLAFLALPHGAAAPVAMSLLARGIKVADLGSDFRLDTVARYREAYGTAHPYPEQLGRWPFGIPELYAASIASSDRVAVPGCYPTSAVLAVAPLLAAGLVSPERIVVDSISGVSGAGRTLDEGLLFGAIDESVRAYAVTTHRHRPEMERALGATVVFTPHLAPMQRGILTTVYAATAGGADAEAIAGALEKAYDGAPFVDVIDRPPETRWVVGSNRCLLASFVDERTGTVIVLAALDNLVKGAAGQGVQCANLMLGLDEAAGLPVDGWMP
jgi:N-acetyl-gamma-glutamyl-phosphate reductase